MTHSFKRTLVSWAMQFAALICLFGMFGMWIKRPELTMMQLLFEYWYLGAITTVLVVGALYVDPRRR